jgi:hypothetical protein
VQLVGHSGCEFGCIADRAEPVGQVLQQLGEASKITSFGPGEMAQCLDQDAFLQGTLDARQGAQGFGRHVDGLLAFVLVVSEARKVRHDCQEKRIAGTRARRPHHDLDPIQVAARFGVIISGERNRPCRPTLAESRQIIIRIDDDGRNPSQGCFFHNAA